MGRLTSVNGTQRSVPGFTTNGPIPNGVGPSAMPQGSMLPGGNSFSMGGPGPHLPNGITGSGPPPGAPQMQQNNFQPLTGQRPPLGGPPQQPQQPQQQQRGANGIQSGPFQSPTMAHSPQNSGIPPGQQPPQQGPQHPQAPMGPLGPSPHLMSRGMAPPGGSQGMNPMMPGQPGSTPTQSYQQLGGRPPSRTATPGQGGMMVHSSPSFMARQPPPGGAMTEQAMLLELRSIPSNTLLTLKQEIGLGDKDLLTLTPQEKVRALCICSLRSV